ncbi:MAG: NAD(P)H-quinone oxidoreductase [Bacteroidia bacterium]|nr:NAD(P)H-quinone oxidoreductase [Bacteroidia bacterium]
MKAIRIREAGGPEVLELSEYPQPVPGEGQVLIRVAATALNRADILQREGKYPPPSGESEIPGLEVSGWIEALGPGCHRFEPGEAVCALLAGGGYATYVTVHETLVMPVPAGMSLVAAAAIPEAFITAWQALTRLGQVEAGETVLIHAGGSGVGTAAIQLAAALGAIPIVTASPGKHALCLSLGAAQALDYKAGPFVEACLAYTDRRGINLAIDCIGGPYLSQHLEVLAPDGRLVLLAAMGGTRAEADLRQILRKRLTLMGSTLRNRSLAYKAELVASFGAFAAPLWADGTLRPVLDQVMPWTAVAAAHTRLESNLSAGKIVLTVSADPPGSA